MELECGAPFNLLTFTPLLIEWYSIQCSCKTHSAYNWEDWNWLINLSHPYPAGLLICNHLICKCDQCCAIFAQCSSKCLCFLLLEIVGNFLCKLNNKKFPTGTYSFSLWTRFRSAMEVNSDSMTYTFNKTNK